MGLPFHTLHVQRQVGTPTVSVQCDFTAPSRWHDTLRQVLEVRRIGGAAVQFEVRFEGADGQRPLACRPNSVTIEFRSIEGTPHPSELRAPLQADLGPPDGFYG